MSNRDLPMMPWYPDQFAASTSTWTWLERGLYRTLLDLQWQTNVLPADEKRLARACGIDVRTFRKLWETVRGKFQTVEGGGLQNFRLEEHRRACAELKRARTEAGRAGGLAKAQHSHGIASSNGTNLPVAKSYSPTPTPTVRAEHPQPPQGGGHGLTANGGRKPRGKRDASLNAWRELLPHVDHVRGTGLTWAYVGQQVGDHDAYLAAEQIGFKRIAERDRYTEKALQSEFRDAYERLQRTHQEQVHQ